MERTEEGPRRGRGCGLREEGRPPGPLGLCAGPRCFNAQPRAPGHRGQRVHPSGSGLNRCILCHLGVISDRILELGGLFVFIGLCKCCPMSAKALPTQSWRLRHSPEQGHVIRSRPDLPAEAEGRAGLSWAPERPWPGWGRSSLRAARTARRPPASLSSSWSLRRDRIALRCLARRDTR